MKKLKAMAETFRGMDFYDVVNHAGALSAALKTRSLYRLTFGSVGAGAWIKKPDQIYGAARIFIGERVRIEKGAVLYAVRRYSGKAYEGTIHIGDGTFANKNFNVTAAFFIEVGKDVAFGTNVFLNDFDHGYDDPELSAIQSDLVSKGGVRIGDKCWLGSNTYVGSGVQLGEHCVVAANSVVTKSFPAYSVIAGAPARLLKRYDHESKAWVRVDETGGRR